MLVQVKMVSGKILMEEILGLFILNILVEKGEN